MNPFDNRYNYESFDDFLLSYIPITDADAFEFNIQADTQLPWIPKNPVDYLKVLGAVGGAQYGDLVKPLGGAHPVFYNEYPQQVKDILYKQWLEIRRAIKELPGGILPDDRDFDAEPSQPWYNWPRPGDNATKLVYKVRFKDMGAMLLYNRTDLMNQWRVSPVDIIFAPYKFDSVDKRWKQYNADGMNRSFVWVASSKQWQSGFDFFQWISENGQSLASAVQIAVSAILTVVSFGAGGATLAATTATVVAAAQAASNGLVALANGDMSKAVEQFSKAFGDLASKTNLGKDFEKSFSTDFFKSMSTSLNGLPVSPLFLDFAKIGGAVKSLVPGDLLIGARDLAKTLAPYDANFVRGQMEQLDELSRKVACIANKSFSPLQDINFAPPQNKLAFQLGANIRQIKDVQAGRQPPGPIQVKRINRNMIDPNIAKTMAQSKVDVTAILLNAEPDNTSIKEYCNLYLERRGSFTPEQMALKASKGILEKNK